MTKGIKRPNPSFLPAARELRFSFPPHSALRRRLSSNVRCYILRKQQAQEIIMENRTNLESPCGLHCGVCNVYNATQTNDLKLLRVLLRAYRYAIKDKDHASIENLKCDECRSERISILCSNCSIRECSARNKISGCHKCNSFPCDLIDTFPIAGGRDIIMRSIADRIKFGTTQWAENEMARYKCPECGSMLYRGETRCRTCSMRASGD